MASTPLTRRLTLTVLLLAGVPALHSQETEDPVVLNPFEVKPTEEEGYMVTDSNSATKVTVDRRDLPFEISTISSDLIRDMGANNALEILNLSSAARPEVSVFAGDNNRPYIRGTASTRFYVDGLFYNTTQAPGNVATDRVEILQGAAASLFGQGEPGGTVNYVLKQPLAKAAGSIQTQFGSYALRQGTLDWGGPLSKNGKLTSRFGLSTYDSDSSLPYQHTGKNEAYGRVRYTYRPGSYVELVGNYTKSNLDALAVSTTDGYHGQYDPGTENDIQTKFVAQGLPNPLTNGAASPNQLLYDRNSFGNLMVRSLTANLVHKIGEHFTLKATGNIVLSPRNTWRPTFNPYKNVILTPVTYMFDTNNDGIKDTTVTYHRGDIVVGGDDQLRRTETDSKMAVVNFLTEYEWKNVRWKNVLGVDLTEELYSDEDFASTLYNTLDPVLEVAKLKAVSARDRLIAGNVLQPQLGLNKPLENTNTYTVPDGKYRNTAKGPGYYMVNIFQLFNQHLSIVSSIRHDDVSSELRQFYQVSKVWTSNQTQDASKTTYSIGAVANLNSWLGVFANYATTFRPQVSFLTGAPDTTLPPEQRTQPRFQAAPTEGRGGDAGLRFVIRPNKLFVSTSVFDVKKEHIIQTQLLVVNETDGSQNSYNYNTQLGEQEVKGYSIEATSLLTKGLTLITGYTHLDGRVTANPGDTLVVGQRTPQTPEGKLSAIIRYAFSGDKLRGLAIGANLTDYMDNKIVIDAPAETNGVDLRRYYKGSTTLDLFASYRWRLANKRSIVLQGNIFNVTDLDYSFDGREEAPGTNIRTSLTYNF